MTRLACARNDGGCPSSITTSEVAYGPVIRAQPGGGRGGRPAAGIVGPRWPDDANTFPKNGGHLPPANVVCRPAMPGTARRGSLFCEVKEEPRRRPAGDTNKTSSPAESCLPQGTLPSKAPAPEHPAQVTCPRAPGPSHLPQVTRPRSPDQEHPTNGAHVPGHLPKHLADRIASPCSAGHPPCRVVDVRACRGSTPTKDEHAPRDSKDDGPVGRPGGGRDGARRRRPGRLGDQRAGRLGELGNGDGPRLHEARQGHAPAQGGGGEPTGECFVRRCQRREGRRADEQWFRRKGRLSATRRRLAGRPGRARVRSRYDRSVRRPGSRDAAGRPSPFPPEA